jgi:hypothetical protein
LKWPICSENTFTLLEFAGSLPLASESGLTAEAYFAYRRRDRCKF